MKRRLFFTLLSFSLVIVILSADVSCIFSNNEGEVPAYKTGDKWIYKTVIDNVDYTYTFNVAGTETINNKDCYVLDLSFNPPLFDTFSTGKVWTPTSDPYFSTVKGQMEGTDAEMSTSISTEFTDGFPWPLEVGKLFSLTEVLETNYNTGGIPGSDTETETSTWKVEGKEDVTVTAGTFNCFILKKYNEDGELLNTWWYSDDVKNDVKKIDAVTGDTDELKSYSIG